MEGLIFIVSVINARKSRVILLGFFSMKSNNWLSDSSLRAQTFIIRGILSIIFKEFSSNSLRLGASNRCALTPPIPKLFTPAIPVFQVFQLKKRENLKELIFIVHKKNEYAFTAYTIKLCLNYYLFSNHVIEYLDYKGGYH